MKTKDTPKGYRIDGEGYLAKWQKAGKYCPTKSYKRIHSIIVERVLKRSLKKGEVVHHINGDKLDNRKCNLLICNQAYHAWLHQRMAQLYMEEHFGDDI